MGRILNWESMASPKQPFMNYDCKSCNLSICPVDYNHTSIKYVWDLIEHVAFLWMHVQAVNICI